MENKTCLQCGNEFESKVTPGVEQKYCSRQCRMKAGNERRFETIKKNIVNEIKSTSVLHPGERFTESYNLLQGRDSRVADGNRNITDNHLATIKELYEAKTETIFYKLKCENLEKELNELKIEFHNLEQEYESIDEGEEESGYSAMLGGVMEQFKQDPINTMNFATELIGNLFKPKKNETTVKS